MAAEHVRSAWTDQRLDDLARRVDRGFARVDARFDSLDARLDARFDVLETGFNARIDSLQRTMIVTMASILIAFAALIATQL